MVVIFPGDTLTALYWSNIQYPFISGDFCLQSHLHQGKSMGKASQEHSNLFALKDVVAFTVCSVKGEVPSNKFCGMWLERSRYVFGHLGINPDAAISSEIINKDT